MGVRGFVNRISRKLVYVYVNGEDFGVKPGKVILDNDRYMNRYREGWEQEQYQNASYYLRFYISRIQHKKVGRIRGRLFDIKVRHSGIGFYNEMILIPQYKLDRMEEVGLRKKWIKPILKQGCKITNSLLYDPTIYHDAKGDSRNYV